MVSSSKAKGNGFEREVVNQAKKAGLSAERAYASDGRSLGLSPGVDLLVNGLPCQCKRLKRVADYIKPSDDVYAQIVRADREKAYAIIRLEDFLELIK